MGFREFQGATEFKAISGIYSLKSSWNTLGSLRTPCDASKIPWTDLKLSEVPMISLEGFWIHFKTPETLLKHPRWKTFGTSLTTPSTLWRRNFHVSGCNRATLEHICDGWLSRLGKYYPSVSKGLNPIKPPESGTPLERSWKFLSPLERLWDLLESPRTPPERLWKPLWNTLGKSLNPPEKPPKAPWNDP